MVDNGRYEEIDEYDREFAVKELESGDVKRIITALLRLALYDSDWKSVQDICIKYSDHSDENIRGIAVLCFGHLARTHGTLETEQTLPIVKKALQDASIFVRGHAYSALDDIEFFCK